jgi:hypothetical protein
MSSVNIYPADQPTEYYQQLIRQNQDFVMRLTAALKSGAESAAAMTATVRTRSDAKRGSSNSHSTQVAA